MEAEALTRLGEVCHRQGHHDQAAGYHQEALALFREIGDRGGEADALNGAGETLLALGRDQATRPLPRHRADPRPTDREPLPAGPRPGQARADSPPPGPFDQAAGYQQHALALYREIGDRGGEAEALNGAGDTLLATGQPDEARACYVAALILARRDR